MYVSLIYDADIKCRVVSLRCAVSHVCGYDTRRSVLTLFTTHDFYNNCSVNLERENLKSSYLLLTRCYSKKNCVYSEYSTALDSTVNTDNIS